MKKLSILLASLLWGASALAAAPSGPTYAVGDSFITSSGTTHAFSPVTMTSPGYCVAVFRLGQAADIVTGVSDAAGAAT